MCTPVEILAERIDAMREIEAGVPGGIAGLTCARDAELLQLLAVGQSAVLSAQGILAAVAGEISRRSGRVSDTSLAKRLGESSAKALVAHRAGLGFGEASRLVEVGEAIRPRQALSGEDLPPERPRIAAAVLAGELPLALAHLIDETVAKVAHLLLRDGADELERALVTMATSGAYSVQELIVRCRQIPDRLDPDGAEPRDRDLRDRAFYSETKLGNGLLRIVAELDPERAAHLKAAMQARLNPRRTEPRPADRTQSTRDQARLDAFASIFRDALKADDGAQSGVDTTVLVRIDLEDLVSGIGSATIDGVDTPISAATARRMAVEADVIPRVFTTPPPAARGTRFCARCGGAYHYRVASTLPAFNELHFGHIDATQEANSEPELLRDGYYDYRGAVQAIAGGEAWLVLGPKGSGKSAVLENIRLNWDHRYNRFFSYWNLSSFPVNDVTKIQMGQSAGASRTQAAWEFLLLLRVVESFEHDEGLEAPREFMQLIKALRAAGFITGDWLSRVARWSSSKIKVDAKLVGGEADFAPESITPLDVSAYIWKQLARVRSESQHIVALDGLDSFFFEAEDEWTSLAGLMQALLELNKELQALNLPVSVIAAARSDIVDVLPGPEVNKLKPHSVHLDWHAHGIGAKNHLWTLLSRKVSVNKPEVTNVVTQYLRAGVSIGPHTEMAEFLLDNTRLLPRDLVALMGYLQRTYRGNKLVTEEAAKKAVQTYAEEYFVGEIFDNLAGVLESGYARQIVSFRDALRTAPTRLFTFQFVCDELAGELEPPQIKALLKQMFETGGIGVKNGPYVDFVFRKVSGAGFTTRYEFLLHDALTRAWNRRWK